MLRASKCAFWSTATFTCHPGRTAQPVTGRRIQFPFLTSCCCSGTTNQANFCVSRTPVFVRTVFFLRAHQYSTCCMHFRVPREYVSLWSIIDRMFVGFDSLIIITESIIIVVCAHKARVNGNGTAQKAYPVVMKFSVVHSSE